MLRTATDYQHAKTQIEENQAFTETQRATLQAKGLTPEHVDLAMQPLLSFHAQLQEGVEWYERIRTGDFEPIAGFTEIGRRLIALRIASGLSQKDLAERLGVSDSQVSRDEHAEYFNIQVQRAQAILDVLTAVLNVRVVTRVEKAQEHREPSLV